MNKPLPLKRVVASLVLIAVLAGGVGVALARSNSPVRQTRIEALISHLSLDQKIGQMLMVSFAGTSLSPQAKSMIQQLQPGGITLFGGNFTSPKQLTGLDSSIQKASHVPLFISVDQEGGYVIRITSGVKQLPSEEAYGRQDSPKVVKSDAATEAGQLRHLGINMNLAPVLDVATPGSIIGSEARSYGNNSKVDTSLGLAAISGYQGHGLATTAKHVVGLGTTKTNPETKLPYLTMSPQKLADQLSPFKAAAHAGVDAMMVTHVVIKGVTAANTPASLSHKLVTGILRNQFGYRGVIMTDSLTMGAVTAQFGIGTASTMAVQAGEDILLIAAGGETATGVYQQALSAVEAKVKSGKIPMSEIDASVTRILTLKQKLGLKLPSA